MSDFWKQSGFKADVMESNAKCATPDSFRKRLFRKFDAFQIVKYLNFAHDKQYEKSRIETEFKALLDLKGIATKAETTNELLKIAETLDN